MWILKHSKELKYWWSDCTLRCEYLTPALLFRHEFSETEYIVQFKPVHCILLWREENWIFLIGSIPKLFFFSWVPYHPCTAYFFNGLNFMSLALPDVKYWTDLWEMCNSEFLDCGYQGSILRQVFIITQFLKFMMTIFSELIREFEGLVPLMLIEIGMEAF